MATDRERTAIHEGAHCVAGFLLGRKPDWVTIQPGDGFTGRATFLSSGVSVIIPEEPPPGFPVIGMDARSRRAAEQSLVIALAGPAATRAYCRDGGTGRGEVSIDPPDLDADGLSDVDHCFELTIRQAAPSVVAPMLDYYEALADDLVRRPIFAALLSPLRDALLDRGTLSGAEVRRLLRNTKRNYDERTTSDE